MLRHSIGKILVPDAAPAAWFRRKRALLSTARRFAPDLVISTSPPHGLHLVGIWLSARLGTPLVVDFRDPYVGDKQFGGPMVPPAPQLNRAVERRIVRRSALVLTAGQVHRDELVQRYPEAADRIHFVPNGFHPSAAPPSAPRASVSTDIELVVLGVADSDLLHDAIHATLVAWPEQKIRLRTVGIAADRLRDLPTEVDLDIVPWLPPNELAPVLEGASVLLALNPPAKGDGGGTSTKLYQYIDANRPILAVNPTVGDQLLLRRWAASITLREPDEATLAAALRDVIGRTPPADISGFRSAYRWDALAERMSTMVQAVASNSRASS